MKRPLGAQISHMLKSRGVGVIFGIPGVHNQEMYRGIEEAGITHILARHEQGAGFMADGYARATGRPGVAYVITGPGLTNIMTPMGQAYSDSVPMLVISSCLDETAAKQGQLHQMKDQEAAARTVCDWSETARTAGAAYQMIDRALSEFETTRPRPKHIQVPIHVLEAMAPPPPDIKASPTTPIYAHPDAVIPVTKALRAARRPLFIVGGGAARMQVKVIHDVLERSGAASFVTYAGRGTVRADDPLFFGSTLARPGSAKVIARADCIIAVGTELSEVDLWRDELGHTTPLFRVDIDPVSLADAHRSDTPILMTSDHFFRALRKGLTGHEAQTDWTAEEVVIARAGWRAQTDAERPGIVPICDALQAVLPPKTRIYSDMTQLAYVAKEVWDMKLPTLWHHPYGFGTLGYALPAGIGGALNGQTAVIAGDYGFQYTSPELATAVELGLSLPIILWDNGKLKEIEDSMTAAQIAPNAVIAQNPDFCKLAQAYGASASAPRNLKDFTTAIRDALKADCPTLIHVTPETGQS